jgi:hypothetical protein
MSDKRQTISDKQNDVTKAESKVQVVRNIEVAARTAHDLSK